MLTMIAAPAPDPSDIVDQLLAEIERDFPLAYTEDPTDAVKRLISEVSEVHPAGGTVPHA